MEILSGSDVVKRGIKAFSTLQTDSDICQPDREILNDIVDAFLENDLARLINLEQSMPGLLWYKHLKKGALKKINPIMSNIMSQLLEAKIDLLWKNVEVDNNGSIFNARFIRQVERFTQSYGEVVLRLSYVDNEVKYKFFNNNYEYHRDNFDEITIFKTWEYYFYEDEDYRLVQEESNGKLKIYLLDEHDEEVPLETIPELANLVQETTLKHKFHFLFKNDRNLTQIIGTVNTIDMNLSNIDYTTMRGIPFMILQQSMAQRQLKQAGSMGLDDENIEYQLTDLRDFVVNTTEDGTNPAELHSPEVYIEKFQQTVDYFVGVAANVVGVSSLSLGSNVVASSANSTAEGLKEREKLTLRTKVSERNQRLEQFEVLMDELGINPVIRLNDEEENLAPAMLTALKEIQQLGLISWEEFIKEFRPAWGRPEIETEKGRIRQDKLFGISSPEGGVF